MKSCWKEKSPKIPQGILVAADEKLEWMLPWWHCHYAKNNSFPVALVDLGLSPNYRTRCIEKGIEILDLTKPPFIAEKEDQTNWELLYAGDMWRGRQKRLTKPFALLQTPFKQTIYLDLDCEVKGSLEPLFAFADHPAKIALAQERIASHAMAEKAEILQEGETLYNSGVISFQHGSPLIPLWAEKIQQEHSAFMGDQTALARLLWESKKEIALLPSIWNWRMADGENPDAQIIHWVADPGKKHILQQLMNFLCGS